MNILFYRYGSICEPDIITGFQELGNSITEITIEIYNKNFTPEEGVHLLSDTLLSHNFDFVFSVNFYPFIADVCNLFQIRYVCWLVVSPVMELRSSALEHKWNRIFLFDRMQYNEFAPYNPDCIFYLPLATNPARWNSVIEHASVYEMQKFSSDISFVGSLYTEKCPYDDLQNPPDYLSGYLNGIMTAQSKVYGYNFLEELLPDAIVNEFRLHFPNFYIPSDGWNRNDCATIAQLYLGPKITSIERLHIMQLLGAKYPVHLYTGSNTIGLPVINKGRVKTLTEMPLVFHNSKINLNITSKSIRSGLPLRIFDVLGCGGFLLTNYQSELPELFTIGLELDCYTDDNDLMAKIEYYLSHEKDRAEIAYNGQLAVAKYHNYPERLLEMIEIAYGLTKGTS